LVEKPVIQIPALRWWQIEASVQRRPAHSVCIAALEKGASVKFQQQANEYFKRKKAASKGGFLSDV
jgi:hypothetical protein